MSGSGSPGGRDIARYRPHSIRQRTARLATSLPFHYGWIVVAAGLLTVFASIGLARFALGMLLPSMGQQLGLDYAQMGWIGTANFVGYLIAVVACGRLVRRWGASRVISAALLVIALSLLLVSRSGGFTGVLLLYFITGIGSGGANVPIMGLISHWFEADRRGRAAGFMVMGNGLAFMLSGLLLPAIEGHWGADGWRMSWAMLSLIILAIAWLAWLFLRDTPSQLGLEPHGTAPPGGRKSHVLSAPARRRLIAHLGAIYFVFGFTYVIYATFIVTTLVDGYSISQQTAGGFWFWVGLVSLPSGPLFGMFSDRVGRRIGLAAPLAMQAVAYLIVGLSLPGPALYLSVLLFGASAWAVPSIMAAAVGDRMGAEHAVAAFGAVTFIFGLGQIAGPAMAGLLAEQSGNFASSYLLTASVAIVGALLALLLRPGTDQLREPVTVSMQDG